MAGLFGILLLAAAGAAFGSQSHEDHASHAPADPGGDRPLYEQTPGHRRMLELLRDIRDRAPEEHYWLNDRKARELRARAAALPTEAPDFDRFELSLNLGEAEQRLGREREAIDALSLAYALLPKVERDLDEGIVPRVIFNLGFAYMRWGETQNCALDHNAESCLLPIRGDGVHRLPEGSRKAIAVLRGSA